MVIFNLQLYYTLKAGTIRMQSVGFKCIQCGNCFISLRDAFERMQNGPKLKQKVGQKRGVRVEIFYRGLI
jgi:hypothetical protein